MPSSPSRPPSTTNTAAIPIPTWNASTEASSPASATSDCTSSGTPCTSTAVSGWDLACSTADATWGRDLTASSSPLSRRDPNEAATTAPTAATATRPATRAIALFIPEAMPAFESSASASTVAVSGATVIDSPSPKSSSAGRRSPR